MDKLNLKSANSERDLLGQLAPQERSLLEFRDNDLPIAEHLKNNTDYIRSKIELNFDTLLELENKYVDLFNKYKMVELNIQDSLNDVKAILDKYQITSSDSEELFLWSPETFNTSERLDMSRTTAFVSNTQGYAMLKATKLIDINNNIKIITIDKEKSIGIPGNNLEIQREQVNSNPDSKNVEPQLELYSSIDSRSNINYMVDGKPDSWFEWEVNYIPNPQSIKMLGAAMIYDKSGTPINILEQSGFYGWKKFIQWAGETTVDKGPDGKGVPIYFTEEKPAKVTFNIKLKTPVKISSIQITPRLINNIYPIVRSIKVFNSVGVKEIANNVYLTEKLNESFRFKKSNLPEKNYAGMGIWTVDIEDVESIQITLEATGFYKPQLGFGHKFYFQQIHKRKEVKALFFSFVDHDIYYERLPNEEETIKTSNEVSDLSGVGTLVGNLLGGTTGGFIGNAIGGLFSTNNSTWIEREGSGYDIIDGKRSVIGIKDIDLSIREYEKSSVVYTRVHEFSKPVRTLSIISTDEIPDSWPVGEYIKYEVSPDSLTWVTLKPSNKAGSEDAFINFNSDKCYVRITLSRPDDKINESPILRHFVLKGLP